MCPLLCAFGPLQLGEQFDILVLMMRSNFQTGNKVKQTKNLTPCISCSPSSPVTFLRNSDSVPLPT